MAIILHLSLSLSLSLFESDNAQKRLLKLTFSPFYRETDPHHTHLLLTAMSKVAYTFRKATLQDAAAIVRITNDAFMADAFFKKPEFVTRFNEAGVTNMISNPDECGVFLLAEDGGSNVIGSIHVEPYIKRFSSDYSSPEVR